MNTLYPFLGFRRREHFGAGPGPHVLTTYDTDQSGTKTYRFNSLGFRSEEFNPSARRHIFCCGCSYLAGVGLNYEETILAHFKRLYVEALGLADTDVNLMNFSMGSASNDYIARTLVTQIQARRPHVVIACYTHINRAEYINMNELGQNVYSIGPWYLDVDEWSGQIAAAQDVGSGAANVLVEAAAGYYTYFTETLGLLRFVSDALLVQLFCDQLGIEYVALWVEPGKWSKLEANFVVAPLMRAVRREHFVPPSAYEFPFELDLAADNIHPGPKVHAHLAERLYETYARIYRRQTTAA